MSVLRFTIRSRLDGRSGRDATWACAGVCEQAEDAGTLDGLGTAAYAVVRQQARGQIPVPGGLGVADGLHRESVPGEPARWAAGVSNRPTV